MANTSKGVLFLPPSDACVRSFLYLLCTLIKLYYTKALSDQASSLAPNWIILLQRPRIPVSFRGSTTTFHLGGSSGILQDKVRMLGALVDKALSHQASSLTPNWILLSGVQESWRLFGGSATTFQSLGGSEDLHTINSFPRKRYICTLCQQF